MGKKKTFLCVELLTVEDQGEREMERNKNYPKLQTEKRNNNNKRNNPRK